MSQCSRGAVRNIPRNVSHHSFRKSSAPPRVSTSRFCSANTPSISWPKFARKSAGNARSRPRNILCESDKFDVGAKWAMPPPFLSRRAMPIASSEIVSSRAPAKAPHPFVPLRPQPLPCRNPSTGSNGGARHPNQSPAARLIPQSGRNFPGAPGCRTKCPRSAAPYPRCAAPLLSESRSRAFRHPPARSTPETSPASSAKTLPHSCSWSSPARLPVRRPISPAAVLYRLQEDYIVTRYSFSHVRDHQATWLSAEISGVGAAQLLHSNGRAVRSRDASIPPPDSKTRLGIPVELMRRLDARFPIPNKPFRSCCRPKFDRNRDQSESKKPFPGGGHGNRRRTPDSPLRNAIGIP